MINLCGLSTARLAQLDEALEAMDDALEMLLDTGAVDERDGVDLSELSDALAAELEFREAAYE